MKKIFLFLAAACALTACDPEQEDYSNGGHITSAELLEKTVVTVDKASDGTNGNVITCETFAPVNAKWTIGGKDFLGNYAWKKMKLGEHTVTVTALCADGTELTADYTINCQTITNPLERYWIYGKDSEKEPPFKPAAWNAADMRFSANEGNHFPFLSDDIYWGFKTLIFDITDATEDCAGRVMNGWWSARYDGGTDEPVALFNKNGQWELPLTEEIAKDCAQGNNGSGKDLDLMICTGSCTVNAVYYEE